MSCHCPCAHVFCRRQSENRICLQVVSTHERDAHFLGSFLKGDSGMLSPSFLIQLYLLHSTLHKHSRNLFHLVAFSTLLLRDCPLGTKLRTLLLSSGGVQQEKTVRRKANTQSCVQVSSGLQAEHSQPPSAWSWSWSQPPQSGGSRNFLVVCADLAVLSDGQASHTDASEHCSYLVTISHLE